MVELAREQAITHVRAVSSPSESAKASSMISEQTNYSMNAGRIAPVSGYPISFYHPIFSRFTTLKDDPNFQPTPSQVRDVNDLLIAIVKGYRDESARLRELWPILMKVLGRLDGLPKFFGFCPDAVVLAAGTFIAALILEVNNEVGTGGSDPRWRAALSYRKIFCDASLEKVRNGCCCPCFLLSIAGDTFTLHGGVFAETFIVQPLTHGISAAGFPDQDGRAQSIAKVFAALFRCLEDLDGYYRAVHHLATPQLASFSPFFQDYRKNGQKGKFTLTYTSINLLPGRDGRAMFNALLNGSKIKGSIPVKVKFARRYCVQGHQVLSDHDLAPKLRHWETSAEEKSLESTPESRISGRVLRDIESALRLLHGEDLVFGDLRRSNIIPLQRKGRDGRSERGAMLVDFDWTGKDGVQRYPVGLNVGVEWPQGVQGGEVMKKEHDIAMLRCYAKTNVTTP
ncbi:hypothetical protein FRC00_004451 [Tulasnella sp. 408]|nr:hypothetical protein FRC00_004451 [Tulasnella sp. 408]